MDQGKVDKVVGRLEDDHFRQGGILTEEDVLRAIDRNALSAEEALAVRAELDGRGIAVGEEPGTEELTGAPQGTAESEGELEDDGGVFLDDLGRYLTEISKVELLGPADERTLGRSMRVGQRSRELLAQGHPDPEGRLRADVSAGAEARDDLVEANLRLVIGIARYYSQVSKVDIRDLIQEGNIGLMRAAELFDHELGFRFSTYATWWIRQSISRGIQTRGRMIRLPVHVEETLRRIRRTRAALVHELGRDPNVRQLAEQLEMEPEQVQFILDSAASPLSLDAPGSDEDGDGATLSESISAPGGYDPEDAVLRRDLANAILAVLGELPQRERRVIELRFGFADGIPRTLEEVGQEFGVSRERIRQIESRVLERLRHPQRAKRLRDFVDERSEE